VQIHERYNSICRERHQSTVKDTVLDNSSAFNNIYRIIASTGLNNGKRRTQQSQFDWTSGSADAEERREHAMPVEILSKTEQLCEKHHVEISQ